MQWREGARDLTPDSELPIGKNVLELTNIRDTSNYTCVAASKLGIIETHTVVKVQGRELTYFPHITSVFSDTSMSGIIHATDKVPLIHASEFLSTCENLVALEKSEGSRSLKLKVVPTQIHFYREPVTCSCTEMADGPRQVGKVCGPSSYILQSVIAAVIILCTAAAASAAACNDLR